MANARRRSDTLALVSDQRAIAQDRQTPAGVSRSDIERRAYERYCERGCEHGRDLDDWLEAERELQSR